MCTSYFQELIRNGKQRGTFFKVRRSQRISGPTAAFIPGQPITVCRIKRLHFETNWRDYIRSLKKNNSGIVVGAVAGGTFDVDQSTKNFVGGHLRTRTVVRVEVEEVVEFGKGGLAVVVAVAVVAVAVAVAVAEDEGNVLVVKVGRNRLVVIETENVVGSVRMVVIGVDKVVVFETGHVAVAAVV